MASNVKALLAKKINKAPVKAAAPAEVEEVLEDQVEEGVEEEVLEEEQVEETEADEAGEEAEVEEEAPAPAPAPKSKVIAKAPVKATVATKAPVKAPAPAAKTVAKAPVKLAVKTPAKAAPAEAEEEVPTTGRKMFGNSRPAANPKPPKILEAGDQMPRDMFVDGFYEKLKTVEEFQDIPSKAAAARLIDLFEKHTIEIMSQYSLRLFGGTFKHKLQASRLYAPNEVLERVATPYHTLMGEHTAVMFRKRFDVPKTRGTVDADGNFIEGQFQEDGSFVEGTWGNEEVELTDGSISLQESFTPNAPVAKAATKKVVKK